MYILAVGDIYPLAGGNIQILFVLFKLIDGLEIAVAGVDKAEQPRLGFEEYLCAGCEMRVVNASYAVLLLEVLALDGNECAAESKKQGRDDK